MEAYTPSGLTINESLERAKESLRKYRQRENAALEAARSKKVLMQTLQGDKKSVV